MGEWEQRVSQLQAKPRTFWLWTMLNKNKAELAEIVTSIQPFKLQEPPCPPLHKVHNYLVSVGSYR